MDRIFFFTFEEIDASFQSFDPSIHLIVNSKMYNNIKILIFYRLYDLTFGYKKNVFEDLKKIFFFYLNQINCDLNQINLLPPNLVVN